MSPPEPATAMSYAALVLTYIDMNHLKAPAVSCHSSGGRRRRRRCAGGARPVAGQLCGGALLASSLSLGRLGQLSLRTLLDGDVIEGGDRVGRRHDSSGCRSAHLPFCPYQRSLFSLLLQKFEKSSRKWRFLKESCPLPARHKPRSSRTFWPKKHPGDLNFFWLPRKNIVENQKTDYEKTLLSTSSY